MAQRLGALAALPENLSLMVSKPWLKTILWYQGFQCAHTHIHVNIQVHTINILIIKPAIPTWRRWENVNPRDSLTSQSNLLGRSLVNETLSLKIVDSV